MKKRMIVFTVLLCGFACSSSAQADKDKKPYKAIYSSSFNIGKAAHAALILDMWKAWDDNDFDRIKNNFADTVKMIMGDSSVIKGKAAVLEGGKKYRGMMKSAVSVIHAYVPLHSNDTGDDVVCIWGTETDTYADGRVEVKDLHEVWWINKDGKISTMRQWSAKFAE